MDSALINGAPLQQQQGHQDGSSKKTKKRKRKGRSKTANRGSTVESAIMINAEPTSVPISITSISTPITLSSDSDEDDKICDLKTCRHGNQRNVPSNISMGLIYCKNRECPVSLYHKSCVGRANSIKYPHDTNWPCRQCRGQATTASTPVLSVASSTEVVVPVDSEPPLHPEQREIVDAVLAGHNVFYTGSAGTGKSTVLKNCVQKLKAAGKHVDIIAPSGIAAVAVGGGTFFSYMGCVPDHFKDSFHHFRSRGHGKKVRARIKATHVLIIDEISMVENDLMTRLDIIMQEARSSSRPFGGVQIVVTGDFCQLPPVKPFENCIWCEGGLLKSVDEVHGAPKVCSKCKQQYNDEDKWAFASPSWAICGFRCFELKHIHRQHDTLFIKMLQKCRFGLEFSSEERALLCQKPLQDPIKLMPTKVEVQRANERGLRRLGGDSLVFSCLDMFHRGNKEDLTTVNLDIQKYENDREGPLKVLDNHRFEEKLELKVGVLVLLLVNLDFEAKLVNGSQGKIIGFRAFDPAIDTVASKAESPKKRTNRGPDHAMARGEWIAEIREEQVRMFMSSRADKDVPIVDFGNERIRAIGPCCQIREVGSDKPYSLLGRTQIPLTAAWAVTIHKSQGMTLDRVEIDLYASFEREQVYVALSRARDLTGLSVVRMPPYSLGAMNKEVRGFLERNGLLDMQRLLE